jgi:segregation and condensation protein B
MSEQPQPLTNLQLRAALEALLFVAAGPVAPAQLAEALDVKQDGIEEALHGLGEEYAQGRGLSLQWHGGRVQITSAAEYAGRVEKFLGLEATARLSRAGLETLSIVAYRQPVTRPAIDSIRGVNSDGVMKSLLAKGLIQEVGRSDGPGRPILYGTTADFLQHFGLSSLAELPPYDIPDEDDSEEASDKQNGILKD